jgi:hypothetical protein
MIPSSLLHAIVLDAVVEEDEGQNSPQMCASGLFLIALGPKHPEGLALRDIQKP